MIYHRWSSTLGPLEDTAENIWGTTEYEGDRDEPTVFVGLYGLPDFYSLWRHKGKKWIFWCGSDITHFKNGYWLEEGGNIKLNPRPLAAWINKNCESWVENEVEYKTLKELGIESKICPSFLGDVTKFEISYYGSERTKLYTSISGDEFELYGWDKIPNLAKENPNIEFHLYGASSYIAAMGFDNIFFHGRVPKEQMNEEIKYMQGSLRLTEFDGFSEIVAKSLLMGQWPVSLIEYPHTLKPENIELLKIAKEPNYKGREWLLSVVNQFPWSQK